MYINIFFYTEIASTPHQEALLFVFYFLNCVEIKVLLLKYPNTQNELHLKKQICNASIMSYQK